MKQELAAGFTLLELLLVIAIITILAALSLTAFSRAKGKARRMACTNNLRQINLGVRMYSDDSNDKAPKPAGWTSHPYDAYKELMKNYVGLKGTPVALPTRTEPFSLEYRAGFVERARRRMAQPVSLQRHNRAEHNPNHRQRRPIDLCVQT